MCYLPEFLIFHIKRFEIPGKKISKFLKYPKILDMKGFQLPKDNVNNQVSRYRLISIAEHVGRSDTSGHYTAHAFREGHWYLFDDDHFQQVTEKEALS